MPVMVYERVDSWTRDLESTSYASTEQTVAACCSIPPQHLCTYCLGPKLPFFAKMASSSSLNSWSILAPFDGSLPCDLACSSVNTYRQNHQNRRPTGSVASCLYWIASISSFSDSFSRLLSRSSLFAMDRSSSGHDGQWLWQVWEFACHVLASLAL